MDLVDAWRKRLADASQQGTPALELACLILECLDQSAQEGLSEAEFEEIADFCNELLRQTVDARPLDASLSADIEAMYFEILTSCESFDDITPSRVIDLMRQRGLLPH